MNGAQLLLEGLLAYDVRAVFGVPGDTSLTWYDALYGVQDGLRHVLAHDERSAAFMADVHARLTGRPGPCEGPSGAGATYMVPGLAEAQGPSVPLVALVTDNPLSYAHQGALTDIDQEDSSPLRPEAPTRGGPPAPRRRLQGSALARGR